MTLNLARLALVAAVAASALSVAACSEHALTTRNRTAAENMATADAYREAARRCNGPDLKLASGSDGSNPSDYVCSGH